MRSNRCRRQTARVWAPASPADLNVGSRRVSSSLDRQPAARQDSGLRSRLRTTRRLTIVLSVMKMNSVAIW